MKNIYLLTILWVFCINGNAQQWKAPEFGNIQPIETYGLISDIVEWKDTLYAAGYFRNQFGDTIKGIGKFNGKFWEEEIHFANGGFGNQMLDVYQNKLLIWGSLPLSINGKIYNNLLLYDNDSIFDFYGGFNSNINTLSLIDSSIYVSINYTDSIAGQPSKGIAKWDGKQWQAMGKGLDYYGPSLIFEFQGKVHAAMVEKSGNTTINNLIAYWEDGEWKDYQYNEWYNFLPCCVYDVFPFEDKLLLNRNKKQLYWYQPSADSVFWKQKYSFFEETNRFNNFIFYEKKLYFFIAQLGFFKFKDENNWIELLKPISSNSQNRSINSINLYNNKIWISGKFVKDQDVIGNYLLWFDSTITSTNDFFNNHQNFTIYPNPSNQKFTIVGNTQDIDLIRIYNISSQLITEKKGIELSNIIDLKNVPKGLYFVTIHTKFNTVEHNKIIIN